MSGHAERVHLLEIDLAPYGTLRILRTGHATYAVELEGATPEASVSIALATTELAMALKGGAGAVAVLHQMGLITKRTHDGAVFVLDGPQGGALLNSDYTRRYPNPQQ